MDPGHIVAPAASGPGPATSSDMESNLLENESDYRQSENSNLEGNHTPDPEVHGQRHVSTNTASLDTLCDICIQFAKWYSRLPGYSASGWFCHRSIMQIATAAKSCSFCKMINDVLDTRWFSEKNYYVWLRDRSLTLLGRVRYYIGLLPRSVQPALAQSRVAFVYVPLEESSRIILLAVHADKELVKASNISPSILVRPLPSRPCPEVYDRIRVWLDNCVQNHDECNKVLGTHAVEDGPDGTILPRRVIDVGKTGENIVRLLEMSNERGQYCALSHCWGHEKPLMTTSATISNHLAGIPLGTLPKTFREAVEITRGIGLRYLWIDSLCIIQGDKKDWHEQSELMAMVYGRAHMTIAASSAEDSTQGCFFEIEAGAQSTRLPFYKEDVIVGYFYATRNKEYENGNPYRQALRKRAWALQEWTLSRRMLHCTRGGLVWRCNSAYSGEIHELGKTQPDCFFWNTMLRQYTQSILTNPSDRLIALRGITNGIQQTRSDRNHFGIWSDEMPTGLLWSVDEKDSGMVGMEGVPSWSWAAKDGTKKWMDSDDWFQNWSTKGTFDLVGDDRRIIASEGFVDSCSLRSVARSALLYAVKHKPESFLPWDGQLERICILHRKEEAPGSHPTGIAVVDNPETLQAESISEIYYAYTVEGQRRPSHTPVVYAEDYECEDSELHDEITRVPCVWSKALTQRTFYWVLLLRAISEEDNRFERIGMGIVYEEPTGPMKKYLIE